MPLFGAPNVEKLKAKRNIQGLIKALGYLKDTAVRTDAAKALGEIGDAQAVASLVAVLEDKNLTLRTAAIKALGQIGGSQAVKLLIIALGDSSRDVCSAAGEALVTIGAPAVEMLIAALKDGDMRWAVIRVLEAMDWQPGQDESGAAYWAAKEEWSRCGEIGAPAIEPLIAALDGYRGGPRGVTEALGKIGAPAVEPVAAALKDGDPDLRRAAAKALGEIGAPAFEPLAVALKDSDSRVRQAAAKALGKMGTPAVEPLTAALGDKGKGVRSAAARALGKIGTPAFESLTAALKDSDSDVRQAATRALGEIGVPAFEPLTAALNDSNSDVRQAAAKALGKIGTPAVEPLTAALKDSDSDVRQVVATVLEAIDWQPDQDKLGAAYWAAKQEWGRCSEFGALAVEPLIVALVDRRNNVRSAAAQALGKIGAPAVEPLAAALQDGDPHVRQAAARALSEFGAPAVEPLTAALEDRRKNVRSAAAEALDKIGWQPDGGEAEAVYRAAKGERKTLEKALTTLYAFLAEAPPEGVPGFQSGLVLSASQSELEEKIRQKARCPNAKVVIVQPRDWTPPKLNSLSQSELGTKFPEIMWRVTKTLSDLGLPKMREDELIRNGVVVKLPMTGKVFFVYKIK
jgi:HEAT repeat protein